MSLLYSARFYPNIYVSRSPFKIFEYHHLMTLTRFSGSEVVLDLGCGGGLHTLLLAKRARKVIGLDVGDLSRAWEKARRFEERLDVEFFQGQVQEGPFPDGMFDKIFSICVLEHIPEYREVLERCLSLLRHGGELVLSVDSLAGVPEDLVAMHTRDHSVSHYFGAQELEDLLGGLGFRDADVHPIMRSGLAARMFCQGIRTRFSYTIRGAVLRWLALNVAESLCPRRRGGMFLVARCTK